MKCSYVFAVCGDKEHIDTLNYSLSFLKKRTQLPIVVVTDLARNSGEITHDTIVDVKTDEKLTNHQAAIFLKTSLHTILPKNHIYTYLDSDILAIGNRVDDIFMEFKSPISFAADHCTLPYFSPYAVNCRCSSEFAEYRNRFEDALNQKDAFRKSNNETVQHNRKQLYHYFNAMKGNYFKQGITFLRYLFSYPTFKLTPNFIFDKRDLTWKDNTMVPFMQHVNYKRVAKSVGLKWSNTRMEPLWPDGRSVWRDSCNHLVSQIKQTFHIKISDTNWQHWNGGVFIFSDDSHDFLENWHQFTMRIFNDPNWKTRDQGTLIATVWKFGLQHHPMLSAKWNCLADFHNPNLQLNKSENTLTLDGKHYFKPEFVHIYHHFGDTNWSVWNWATSLK